MFSFFKKKKPDESLNQATIKGNTANNPFPMERPEETIARGMVNVKDIIAPSALEVDFDYVKIGTNFYRTLFISGYPRFVGANWLSPVINFEHTLDISMFYYPVASKQILEDLRKKITEMEVTVMSDREQGKLIDPSVKAALEDANLFQEQLVKGVEKYFQFSFYITIPASSLDELNKITKKLQSTLGSLLLFSKAATLQMEQAFQSTVPTALDKLLVTRNMDTTSLATTFPFTSSDLTSDEGIMYGINKHNGSLVIFDRFSLPNANTVVLASSGSGKSYFVKLEALRMMVFGAAVMIVDPEGEYKVIAEAVGGDFITFSPNSPSKINPFDLSEIAVEGENELSQKLASLHTLFKLMLGALNPTEESILDRSLIETYRIKGITNDPLTQREKEPPVMEDLYKVLLGSEEKEARSMAERLEKYIKGSLAGIFDSQSNIKLGNKLTVFSTKQLEDILKPVAYHIILDFVWTRIRRDLKKRILIIEEAWSLLKDEDSARFLYGVAKRARKYYLGLTTISQDVNDFLSSEHGKAVISNSAMQILLKQHPSAIDAIAETFYLSEGEKRLLLSADKGEGLFFAGANHVSIKIKASKAEHNLVTTDPAEILKLREQGFIQQVQDNRPKYTPVNPQDLYANKYAKAAGAEFKPQAITQTVAKAQPAASTNQAPANAPANNQVPNQVNVNNNANPVQTPVQPTPTNTLNSSEQTINLTMPQNPHSTANATFNAAPAEPVTINNSNANLTTSNNINKVTPQATQNTQNVQNAPVMPPMETIPSSKVDTRIPNVNLNTPTQQSGDIQLPNAN